MKPIFHNVLVAGALLASADASALIISSPTSGTVNLDSDYAVVNFDLSAEETVTMETTSYAQGGFDPLLTLLGPLSGGVYAVIAENDDKFFPTILDSYIQRTLGPGSYQLIVTQALNQLNGSSAPPLVFTKSGNYTNVDYGCAQGQFCDFNQQSRGNFWSLAISSVPTNVTEPETLVLMGFGLAGMIVSRRRKEELSCARA